MGSDMLTILGFLCVALYMVCDIKKVLCVCVRMCVRACVCVCVYSFRSRIKYRK